MTKVKDFIMNTDYLSLAQTSTAEFTAYFPAAHFTDHQPYESSRDFSLKATNGAIDRILISRNGDPYTIGNLLIIDTDPALSLFVFRPNASTLRIRLYGYTASSSGYDMPAQTINIKVASFKPPNVF